MVAEIGAQHWWDGMNEIHVREREARSVDELIAEWDRTSQRAGGAQVELDAIEFCRILAEPVHGEGVLHHPLPL